MYHLTITHLPFAFVTELWHSCFIRCHGNILPQVMCKKHCHSPCLSNNCDGYWIIDYNYYHPTIGYSVIKAHFNTSGIKRGEESSPLQISKTWFRDSGWLKRSTQWTNFWVGFGGPRPLVPRVLATPIFPPKVAQRIKKWKISTVT